MTVKSSISLREDQHAFAKALVDDGRFSSVSAVVQQGLDLLRRQDEDARLERAALRQLLIQRAGGPFVTPAELRTSLAERRSDSTE